MALEMSNGSRLDGKPGAILRGLVHILDVDFRVLPDDISGGRPIAQELQHKVHCEPDPSNRAFLLQIRGST